MRMLAHNRIFLDIHNYVLFKFITALPKSEQTHDLH